MTAPPCRRCRSRRPALHVRPVTLSLIVTLATVCTPAAAAVNASYFTFADNGGFIDGDGDYSMTRSRAVVDSGFVHQPIHVDFSGQVTDWTWQAKASASLVTGTLRVYAFSDTSDSGAVEAPPAAGHGWRTQAGANWSDVVTFAAPANAPAGPPVPITFKLDVRGDFAGFYASMTNTSFLTVNGTKSQVDFSWDGRVGPAGSNDATATTSGTVTGLSVDPRQLHGRLEVTVPVTPGTAISVIGSSLSKAAAGPYASATSDFDHTATLSIDMPAGYTFTSQSGVLLSVPEPSTWLSMLAGLALLAGVTARRGLRVPDRGHRGHRGLPMPGNRICGRSATALAAGGLASSIAFTHPVAAHAADPPMVVPLASSSFYCNGLRKESGVIISEDKHIVSVADGTSLYCSGTAAAVNRNAWLYLIANGQAGDLYSSQTLTTTVSVEYYYLVAEKRGKTPPRRLSSVPDGMPIVGNVHSTIQGTTNRASFIAVYVNRDLNPEVLVASLRGNGTLDKTVSMDAAPGTVMHVEYVGQCHLLLGRNESGSCVVNLDPLPDFDQARFDANNAQLGLPTFQLSEYYEYRFSPNMVPEPATWLSMFAGLGVIATVAGKRRRGRGNAGHAVLPLIGEAA